MTRHETTGRGNPDRQSTGIAVNFTTGSPAEARKLEKILSLDEAHYGRVGDVADRFIMIISTKEQVEHLCKAYNNGELPHTQKMNIIYPGDITLDNYF